MGRCSGQDPVTFTAANVRSVYLHAKGEKKASISDAHLSTINAFELRVKCVLG